jgi:DNA-binding MarR family transcriptional regulator
MERLRRDDSLNSVLDALRRITQAIRLSSSVVQDELGITGAQLFVLQQVAVRPGGSLRELAELTLTDQSSVSVVVSRLVDRGYVARRTSSSDARRTELSLTSAGRRLLSRAPEVAQSRLMSALRKVAPKRLEIAASVLGDAARALGPTRGPAPMFFEPPSKPPRAAARRRRPAPPRGRGTAT